MAIIKMVNSKASLANAINYVTNREKTDERLISGINCVPESAIDEMKATKQFYEKRNGRQYTHIVQSFDPKDDISPEQAHEIGERFINETEKFNGFEVVISTHKDREHIHNHFIINSVNFENGKKLHTTKYELETLKEKNVELCKENGLSVPEKGEDFTSNNQAKYYAVKKGFEKKVKSYVLDTGKTVIDTLRNSGSKKEFIELMNNKGFNVNWRDNRKYVVFTDKDGNKVRNSNLAKTFKEGEIFTKEGMTNEFERVRDNRIRTAGRPNLDEQYAKDSNRNTGANANTRKPHSFTTKERSSKSIVYGQGDGEHYGDQRKDTDRAAFDIGKAKEFAEGLRRNVAGRLKERNYQVDGKQSEGTEGNEEYRNDVGNQIEQSKNVNDRKHERNGFELEK